MEEKISEIIKNFKEKTKRDCYKIEMIDEIPSVLDDKIGGKPYLPIGEEYPKDKNGNNMALLLQINLANIDLENYPNKGILEIFTDYKVEWPCEYVVKYFEEGLEYQEDLPIVDVTNYIVSKAYKINLVKTIDYMSVNDYRFSKTITNIVNKVFNTNLKNSYDVSEYLNGTYIEDIIQDNIDYNPITIGGYANFTQQDPRFDMKENKEECLFKLDSWANYNDIVIGDSGILSVLISKEELQKSDFDKALVTWDCC